MSSSSKKKVIIIGGTGYVGQHLLKELSNTDFDLAFTHHSNLPPQPLLQAIHPNCLTFPVDLRNGDGFDAISLTFGQWLDSVLAKGNEVEFYHDEFRCPIFIKDVVTIIQTLSSRWIADGTNMQLILNAGGPDRLSRFQMAETVAALRGYKLSLLKPVSASTIDRGVKSPADISMDISKLTQTLGFSPMKFHEGVKLTLADAADVTF